MLNVHISAIRLSTNSPPPSLFSPAKVVSVIALLIFEKGQITEVPLPNATLLNIWYKNSSHKLKSKGNPIQMTEYFRKLLRGLVILREIIYLCPYILTINYHTIGTHLQRVASK